MDKQRFCARRILYDDLSDIAFFGESLNADYSFLQTDTIFSVIRMGEGWCCTEKGKIVCAGGFLPVESDCELAAAARKTGIFSPNSILVLPVCANDSFLGRGKFFEWCFSRADAQNKVLWSLLPVKSGARELALYFAMGMSLVAMRPMYRLRAYYVFARGGMQIPRENSIMINAGDTHTLSRFLENGYCGVDIYGEGENANIQLVKHNI